jgi:hypothetical protein
MIWVGVGVVVALASAGASLLALYGFSYRCGETCSHESGRWSTDPDSWQWSAQLVIAVAGLALSVWAVSLLAASRRLGQIALVAAVAVEVVWLFMNSY